MDRSDPSFRGAQYGDSMVRLTRRIRCASLPVALICAVGLWYLARHVSVQWLSAMAPPLGIMIYAVLSTRVCRVPWIYDFRPPVLVLRSFSDKSLKEGEYIPPAGEVPSTGGRDPYIWQLSESIWDLARVVTMQEETPEERLELNSIVLTPPDTDWQDTVVEVAHQSWIVLLIPATTPSCMEELELLRAKRLLHKTLVYMPGLDLLTLIRAENAGAVHETDHARNWERVRTSLAGRGFELPPYDQRGMLYLPTEAFAVKECVPCAHLSKARDVLHRLVPRISVLPDPLWNVVLFGNAYEASDSRKRRGGIMAGEIEPGARVWHVNDTYFIERTLLHRGRGDTPSLPASPGSTDNVCTPGVAGPPEKGQGN